MTVRIAPSLLSCDLAHLADEIASVAAGGADLRHLDVMDGVFVPNLTFGPILCAAARRCTTLPLDVHLMVERPEPLIEPFVRAGANRIAVHAETVAHLHRTLSVIRDLGATPGVALNPLTPLAVLDELWREVGFVLVMTVNPGFGGQRFIPTMTDKLARLDRLRRERGPGVEIAVDGGVEEGNAAALRALGVDVLVAGTAVFGAPDRARAIAQLRGEVG
ncbi:MAG: Ribulose-phosphate 3-epimerase [Acidobacteria bacterium]|nr:Ribulose-phosphate 3-epimerase [Acidobacteriota bacterium]